MSILLEHKLYTEKRKILSLAFIGFIIVLFASVSVFESSYSQNSSEGLIQPRANISSDNQNQFSPMTNLTTPVLQKLSENGNYVVSLRFNTFSPTIGFDMEVLFLNPRVQRGTTDTVDTQWTNLSGQSPTDRAMYVDPSIIQYLKPASSYDITIYDDSGNILWQADNEPVYSARSHQRIMFDSEYVGPVTVAITDITQDSAFSSVEVTEDSAMFRFELSRSP